MLLKCTNYKSQRASVLARVRGNPASGVGAGLPQAAGGGVGAGCVKASDSRRHLARSVSSAGAAVLPRPLCTPIFCDRRRLVGVTALSFPQPPSPSPPGLLYSRPREAAELGPRGERPSPLHFPPSVNPRHRPGRRRRLPGPGRAGGLGEGRAAPQVPRLRPFASGRWAPCEIGSPAGGACGRRRPPA